MSHMYKETSVFDPYTSQVTIMCILPYYASAFKRQLCWDVTGKDTTDMFAGSPFSPSAPTTQLSAVALCALPRR